MIIVASSGKEDEIVRRESLVYSLKFRINIGDLMGIVNVKSVFFGLAKVLGKSDYLFKIQKITEMR
jgi:hypothetical protein